MTPERDDVGIAEQVPAGRGRQHAPLPAKAVDDGLVQRVGPVERVPRLRREEVYPAVGEPVALHGGQLLHERRDRFADRDGAHSHIGVVGALQEHGAGHRLGSGEAGGRVAAPIARKVFDAYLRPDTIKHIEPIKLEKMRMTRPSNGEEV